MRPIGFRLVRRARAAWAGTLVLAVAVALASAAVLAIAAGARRTASAPDRFEASQDAGANVEVFQQDGLPRADEVGALPAVADVEVATFLMAAVLPGPEGSFAFAGTAGGIGGTLVEGRQPAPGHTDEFVATDTFATLAGTAVGSTFRFISLDQQQADQFGFNVSEPRGPTFSATLVGIVSGYGDGDPSKAMDPIVVFPGALIIERPIPVRSSVMAVTLRDGSTVEDLRAQLAALANPEQFTADVIQKVSDDVRTAVGAQATALWLLAAGAAVAELAALGQIASRRARLSEAEQAGLAAIGMTGRQIAAESIAHGAAPVVLGALLAAALAPLLSGLFPTGFARRIDPTSGLRFDPLVSTAGAFALALALVLWVAVALVLFGRRRPSPGRVGVAARLASSLPRPAIATGVRFAFSRSRSDRGLALGSLLGVAAASAAVVGALTFGASLDRLVREPDRFGDPFTVRFGDAGQTVPSEALQASIAAHPDVIGMSLITSGQALVGDVGVGVTAVERRRGPLPLRALEGELPAAPDEVAFGRLTARALGLSVGDDVVLAGPSGPQAFRVSGLAVIPSLGGVDGVGHDALVTLDGMRRLDPDALGIGVGIVMRPGWTLATVRRLAAQLGLEEQLGQPVLPTPVANLDRVSGVPYLLVGLVSALGALTIAHALLVSARNRRKDVAVLGALGADRRWLSTVVHWQAISFTVVPLVAGVPIGMLVGRQIFRLLADRVGVAPEATAPLRAIVLVLLAALALANLAALVPARRARRLDAAALLHTR